MPEQQVMWTALPRAAGATTLEIDVLVSPRLGVGAPPGTELALSDFPDFEHWTKTVENRLTFKVELGDGSRHDAEALLPAALDHDAWDHLFRATTFVRPWVFKDLAALPVFSYSVRFITAYLRDLYTDLGRRFPTRPPPRGELDGFRETVAPVVDVRVEEERRAPDREEQDIPVPRPEVPPDPAVEAGGCARGLWGLLERICRLLRPVCKRLPRRLQYALRIVARLLRAALAPEPAEPPDPTKPKGKVQRTVHPSPYRTKPPIAPAQLAPLDKLEAEMAAHKAVKPQPSHGAIATALAGRDVTFDFARVKRFYERPESETPPAAPPKVPKLDFHQAIGALGDYPELMRRLGLVVRLRFSRPEAAPGTVRVIPLWDGAMRPEDIGPRTRCELDSDRFEAAQKPDSDLARGALALGDCDDRLATDTPKFDVVQVDADGAAMKAILTAATLERARRLDELQVKALGRPQREAVPALRSAGLALVRADRAWHLHDHLVDAAAQATPKPAAVTGEPAELAADLFADDLVRGYRIEVKPGDGAWKSLCERVGTYDLVGDDGAVRRRALEATDQGYVKRTSGTSAGDGKPLYVHEALARWTGWSLVAPRPGLTLENHLDGPLPDGEKYDRPAAPRSEVRTEFRLLTGFRPKPRSLPMLRFGQRYAMRAVAVDLCGEPLAALPPDAPQTRPVTYRRFEPVGPPAPLALRKFWPGESLERVVLRSDWDRDSATYDQQEMNASGADQAAQRTRHVLAPKTSQETAELHGKLDDAFGDGGQPDAGYRISLRESGTFADALIVDVATVDVNNPQPTISFGQPVDLGDYWINRADATLPTPYLPDPLAAGVALRGVPGLVDRVEGDALSVLQVRAGDDPAQTEPLLQVPYTGDWPDLDGFRVRVAEDDGSGTQPPRWDASERLLTIFLPKAGRAEVRYSSYLLPAALESHGVWDWLDDGPASSQLRSVTEAGAHWMITPSRTLVLVHAVQHPVERARFTQLDAVRTQIGQTTAELADGLLRLHVPSTGRIDVIGRWTEWLDDEVDGVRTEVRESVACDFAVPEDWTDGMAFPPPAAARTAHEFGDTRHRRVSYLVRATSRFREYLREDITTPELTRDTLSTDVIKVPVRNSAPPLAPGVLYAVPAFDWPRTAPVADWNDHEDVRGGGGLRVYLDRPWYQTGEGELLGVVLEGQDPLPDPVRSRYGLDAIWAGGPQHPEAARLEPHHFVNAAAVQQVTLAEPGDPAATVVGFGTEWDKQRKVFFADIELDVDALPWNYWPFVRLAFVRFQPVSLPGATVSKVVPGEFGQVAPRRTLSLVWQDDGHVLATLRGRAPAVPRPPRVAFRVQRTPVAPGDEPDELDWVHAGGHAEQIEDSTFFSLTEPDDPGADGELVWETVVTLPAPRGTERLRLEVAEYEWLATDKDLGRAIPRITYATHVALD